jgi:hypothetical protein
VIEIRSYRRVFELERRVYRIDRLRLNPTGVPVRGIVYFLALLGGGLLVGVLPPLSLLAAALPWYVRAVALPGLGAAALTLIRIEGRPFHLAALAVARYATSPARLSGAWRPSDVGEVWWPHQIPLLPDGSDTRMRRLRYKGPGVALVAREHSRRIYPADGMRSRRWTRGRALVSVREASGAQPLAEGQVIVLEHGVRMVTAGERARPAQAIPGAPDRACRTSTRGCGGA